MTSHRSRRAAVVIAVVAGSAALASCTEGAAGTTPAATSAPSSSATGESTVTVDEAARAETVDRGVISTAGDLADWAEVLVTGEALDPETQQVRLDSLQATSDQPEAPRYGYALAEMGPFLGHTGGLPGYNSFMGHQPDTDVTLIVWTNLAPGADGKDPAAQIAKKLAALLYPAG